MYCVTALHTNIFTVCIASKEMLFDYLDTVMPLAFPSTHGASIAYSKYKKTTTLRRDVDVVFAQYKTDILSGNSSWLRNNLVVIGKQTCGIYLSALYYKTMDEKVLKTFVAYCMSADHSVIDTSSDTGSDTSSDAGSDAGSDDEYDGDTPLDVATLIYNRIKPQLGEMVTGMERPPPRGVTLGKKSTEVRKADIAYIRDGMSIVETQLK